jgi:hypothetical protein
MSFICTILVGERSVESGAYRQQAGNYAIGALAVEKSRL